MQKIDDRHLTKLDEGIKSRFSIMVAQCWSNNITHTVDFPFL